MSKMKRKIYVKNEPCMFIRFKYKKEIREHIFLYIIRENFLNIYQDLLSYQFYTILYNNLKLVANFTFICIKSLKII